MATEQTSGRPGGAVAEVKEKGDELLSSTQRQIATKTRELGEDVSFQVREQLDERSTQAGEHVQAVGHALQTGVEQLRSEGKDVPAKVMTEVAERAEDLGAYLQSAQADRMLTDLERIARRRPWVTAGAGVLAGFVASRFLKASADRRYGSSRTHGIGYASQPQRSLASGGA
jgi:gas vesicle protein